jgi:cytochrome c biogenesis protein CcmG/thiol:disulfide interchange protein DsbE
MRHASSLLSTLAALVAGTAFAQTPATPATPTPQPPPSGAPKPPPDPMEVFDATNRNEEAILKASARLRAAAKAYRDAIGIQDRVTVSATVAGQAPQRDTMDVLLGAGTDAMVSLNGAKWYAADGKITLVPEVPIDRAVQGSLKDPASPDAPNSTLPVAAARLAPGFSLPMPHFALRAGVEGDPNAAVDPAPFVCETIGSPRIVGFQTTPAGDKVLVAGDNGALGVLDFDHDTSLLRHAMFRFTPPGAPAGFVVALDLTYAPKILPAAPAITLDLGSRTVLDSIQGLQSKMIAVGAPVPDGTLRMLDGSAVSLASLKGSAVVLDFWATWCAPCRRAMPYVDQVARWAAESGKPIRVFGVNTRERGDAAERMRTASEYWTAQNFALQLAFDADDSLFSALGLDGLPTLLVIGPDGKVVSVHTGLDPKNPGGLVDAVKRDVTAALDAKP